MVSNLDKEYMSINTIYEQQKEYRKTPEGKLAIKRANEKQLMKKIKLVFDLPTILMKLQQISGQILGRINVSWPFKNATFSNKIVRLLKILNMPNLQ